MRYCLRHESSFEDEIERCPDCGDATVDESIWAQAQAAREGLSEARFVAVHVFDSVVDRAILSDLMDDAGIPCVVHEHSQDAYGALLAMQHGAGVLLVPENNADEARALIRAFQEAPIVEEEGDGV